MKQFIMIMGAASLGVVFGHFGSMRIDDAHAAGAGKIEIRELVLLNEMNETAARLNSVNGRTVLQLFSSRAVPALELGVDTAHSTRFVHFFGKDGRVIAALNSVPPNGEATLFLGDERSEARVILGAFQGDSQPSKGIEEWGLQFRKPGSRKPIFMALSRADRSGLGWATGLKLLLPNGREWEAH